MTRDTDRLTKPQSVVLRVLQETARSLYRTELVKLVYFTDYIYYQHTGRTLTGLKYMWDDYGPNAISNTIVREADELAIRDLLRIMPTQTPYGNDAYLYRAVADSAEATQDAMAELIIKDVVAKYGRRGAKKIADASKRTAPFKNARPGDILDFDRPSTQYLDLAECEPASPDEMAAVGAGRTIGELRQKYGIA